MNLKCIFKHKYRFVNKRIYRFESDYYKCFRLIKCINCGKKKLYEVKLNECNTENFYNAKMIKTKKDVIE